MAMLANNLPRFANIQPYAGPGATLNDTIRSARKEMGGAFSWDEVARYRDKWKKPLVVKGILHPADAEKAVSLGVDGILVSNHGGRQIEALPAPIDCVPAVAKAVGSKATILFDSGVRSGTDVARALALGARPLHRRAAIRARPSGSALAGRGAQRHGPSPRGLRLRAKSSLICCRYRAAQRDRVLAGTSG